MFQKQDATVFNGTAPKAGGGPNSSPDTYGITIHTQTRSFTAWNLSFSSAKRGQKFLFHGVLGELEVGLQVWYLPHCKAANRW